MNLENKIVTEHQTPPVNLSQADISLFEHEFTYQHTRPVLTPYRSVYFNSLGYIYNKYRLIFFKDCNKISDRPAYVNFIKLKILLTGRIDAPAISIHSIWCEGYFHWLTESLNRLMYIIQSGYHLNDYILLLPKKYLGYSYINESLSLFGFNLENIMPIEEYGNYLCKELLICPPLAIPGRYDYAVSNTASEYMLMKAGLNNLIADRRVYISRQNSPKRKVTNELELIKLLREYDFEIVETENMTFIQQMSLFNSTRWLISIHGAGLTNMMFMQKHTNILEFREENDKWNNCYFSLASAHNLNYYYLKCKKEGEQKDHVGNLAVNIQELKQLMDLYI